MLRSFLFY